MFAVVRTGGKQYRVAAGDKIVVDKMAGEAGERVSLGDVLMAGDGGELKSTEGLLVSAEIIAQAKGDKVIVFKKRRRHNYRRRNGHRQLHTILKILSVGGEQPEQKQAQPASAEPAPAVVDSEAPVATASAPVAAETAPVGKAPRKAAAATTQDAAPVPAEPVKKAATKKAPAAKPATDQE